MLTLIISLCIIVIVSFGIWWFDLDPLSVFMICLFSFISAVCIGVGINIALTKELSLMSLMFTTVLLGAGVFMLWGAKRVLIGDDF